MISNISYTGCVTFTLEQGKTKKVYNNGTQQFFNVLYNILGNKYFDTSIRVNLPCYIDIVISDNPSAEAYDTTNSILYNPMSITLSDIIDPDETSDKKRLRYTAFLASSNIKKTTISDNSNIWCVLLDNNTSKNILAYVNYNTYKESIKQMNNTQANITWELCFTNKT